MPKGMENKSPDPSGSEGAKAPKPAAASGLASPATAAFVGDQFGGTPPSLKALQEMEAAGKVQEQSGQPEPAPGEPQKPMLLGRYDLSTPKGFADAEAFLKQQQSDASRANSQLERLEKYAPLVEEIERNPDVAGGVLEVMRKAHGKAPGGELEPPPEIKAEVVKDDLGLPTGEVNVDAAGLQQYIDSKIQQGVQAQVGSALQAHQRENSLHSEVADFVAANPGVTTEQAAGYLRLGRDKSPREVMEIVHRGSTPADGAQKQIAAEDRGRQEVLDQMNAAQATGPSVITQPGGAQEARTPEQIQLEEMLAVAERDRGQDILSNL